MVFSPYDNENKFIKQIDNVEATQMEIKILKNKLHTAEYWLRNLQKNCTHSVIVQFAKKEETESNNSKEYYCPLCGLSNFSIIPHLYGEHLVIEEPHKNLKTNHLSSSKKKFMEIYTRVLKNLDTDDSTQGLFEILTERLSKEGIISYKAKISL